MTIARIARTVLERSDRRLRSLLSLRRAFLRVRSAYSGVSYGKLKLYHLIGLRLGQVLIIERGTGRVMDEWSDRPVSGNGYAAGRPQSLKPDMLAAVGDLERNPKAIFHGGLRALNVGESHVHLHATPAYILAAAYCGPAIRKLERHIDAALRKSLGSTPALMYFTGGGSAELQGVASELASAIEKLLLDANLPPYGKAAHPTFAYTAIAALTLAGITATGEAILQTYPSLHFTTEDFKAPAIPMAPPQNAVTPAPAQIGAADRGGAEPESGAMPHKPAKAMAAPAQGVAGAPVLAVDSGDLLAWEVNRSLLKLSLNDNFGTPAGPDTIVDSAVKSVLSQLPILDPGSGVELDALNRFDFSTQVDMSDLQAPASSSLRLPAISVTDQGVQVGLFSLSGGGSSIFSLEPMSSAGNVGGANAIAGAGTGVNSVAGGVNSAVGAVNSNITEGAVPAVTQTLNNVTGPLRGLAR
jgi:hypothetical protein